MKTLLLALQSISVVALLSFFGNQFIPSSPNISSTSALESITNQFHSGLDDLIAQAEGYHAAAQQYAAAQIKQADLQKEHLAMRDRFKSQEFLLEYIDPQAIKKHINGAPLPKLEPNVPAVVVIEPKGLQVLDEVVFGDEIDSEELLELTKSLLHNIKQVARYQRVVPLENRTIFEAVRLELVRIYTLGLTGFDTPGSVNALPEAHTALEACQRAIRAYHDPLSAANADLAEELDNYFTQALRYLEGNNDFDTFDRLHFLRTFHNPLVALVYQAQKALEIEDKYETTQLPTSHNYRADQLFSEDWLNPYYYAGFGEDQMTEKRRELGRLLFFDPLLSGNNERSCASCHHPENAFTDGQKTSIAYNGEGHIQRNSPTLINCVYTERFFADLREPRLERQMKHVVMDSMEFRTDFLTILDKLAQSAEYRELFTEAYPESGDYQFSKWSMTNALSVYVASLTGFDSPFDRYARNETDSYPEAAARGYNLFMGKAACGTCHFAPTFNGLVPPFYQEHESEVLGTPVSVDTPAVLDPDLGRFASGRPIDEAYFYQFSFKTPTVRNAALTAPYMHNGVYTTLEEVVDFYNKGGGAGMGIDLEHQTLPFDNLQLNEQEVADLVSFMETLTDTTGMTAVPQRLPQFETQPEWNERVVGGKY